jgi:hypothetical protein
MNCCPKCGKKLDIIECEDADNTHYCCPKCSDEFRFSWKDDYLTVYEMERIGEDD